MGWLQSTVARLLQSKTIQRYRLIGRALFTKKNLLLTNVGISSLSSAFGDIIEQHYEMYHLSERKLDRIRTYHMTVSGLTVGVLCHYTYHYLDVFFPGRSIRNVVKKVLVDQIVCSPLCIILFFGTLAVLEKESWETYKSEVLHKGWRLYFAEWMIWPPAQVVNFYLIPPKFRVLYDNMISLGFDIYTSYVKHEIPRDTN